MVLANLSPAIIIAIVVAAVVVLIALMVIINKIKKHHHIKNLTVNKNAENEDFVKKNISIFSRIRILLDHKGYSADTIKKFEKVNHTASFVSVSPKDSVKAIDKEIHAALLKLEEFVRKADGAIDKDFLNELVEIDILYARRKGAYDLDDEKLALK